MIALLLLKTLLVFAAAGLTLFALRRASAAARHLVCLLTLAALLALPLFSLALPGWQMLPGFASPVGALLAAPSSLAAPSGSSESDPSAAYNSPHAPGSSPLPQPPGELARRSKNKTWQQGVSGKEGTLGKEGAASSAPTILLLCIYAGGILIALTRPLLGLWGIRQLSRACVPFNDAPVQSLAADCAAVLHLTRRLDLRQAAVPVPMTWGSARPVVLLPLGAENWPEDRLRAVLLHELAHVRRSDWLGHRFADIVCVLYWFHPLAWLTARRLRAESEAACDDMVLASGMAAPEYARHLLEIARALPPVGAVPQTALPMATTSQVENRLRMILDKTLNRQRITRRVLIGALGISVVLLVGLAVMRPTAKAQAALARPGTAEFLGVQDIDIHHTDRRWWDAEGKTLVGGVNAEAPSRSATDLFRSSNDKNLRFAVRLPDAAQGRSVTFAASGSFALGSFALKEAAPLVGSRSHVWSLYTGFSGSVKTTTLSVGVGAGPWAEVVECPKTPGKVRLNKSSGEVLFALYATPLGVTSVQNIYGSRGLTPVQAAPSNAILIVSDHFHYPSPLKVDKMAAMISSYASRTRSGEAVQKIRNDAENCERIVYGLDKSGRIIAELTGTMNLTLEDEENDRFKMEQLIAIPQPVLKRIAAFRLAARPYQWAEFKHVALQPVK